MDVVQEKGNGHVGRNSAADRFAVNHRCFVRQTDELRGGFLVITEQLHVLVPQALAEDEDDVDPRVPPLDAKVRFIGCRRVPVQLVDQGFPQEIGKARVHVRKGEIADGGLLSVGVSRGEGSQRRVDQGDEDEPFEGAEVDELPLRKAFRGKKDQEASAGQDEDRDSHHFPRNMEGLCDLVDLSKGQIDFRRMNERSEVREMAHLDEGHKGQKETDEENDRSSKGEREEKEKAEGFRKSRPTAGITAFELPPEEKEIRGHEHQGQQGSDQSLREQRLLRCGHLGIMKGPWGEIKLFNHRDEGASHQVSDNIDIFRKPMGLLTALSFLLTGFLRGPFLDKSPGVW